VRNPSVKCLYSSSSLTMSDSDSEAGFDIKEWIQLIKLTEAGAKRLVEVNNITDLETLLMFRETDVEWLKLSLPDALRFRSGIAKLHSVDDSIPKLADDHGFKVKPSAKVEEKKVDSDAKVYSLKDVERLLAGKEAVGAGANALQQPRAASTLVDSLSDLLSGVSSPTATASSSTDVGASLLALLSKPATTSSTATDIRELLRDILNLDGAPLNSRGEKALLPVHFLSCIRGTQDSEELIHSGKGLNLVLQTTNKRVTPGNLTTGQWISANSRILDKLISSGKFTPAQISNYLTYNRKIGDLLQICTPGSVFLLDHNHRLELHDDENKLWSDIDATLQNAHLKRKDVVHSEAVGSFPKSGNVSANPGRRHTRRGLCWTFNSAEGCTNGRSCKYDHVEYQDKSPRASGIPERAPRFQAKGTQGQGSA
jgi:hypothetical protein